MTLPHTLIVDPAAANRFTIECPGVTDFCRSWVEADCPESQTRDEWDDDTWFDWADEAIAHGVIHAFIDGSWSHPTGDCWLKVSPDHVHAAAEDLGLPPGRHAVVHGYECGGEGAFSLTVLDAAVDR